VAIIQQGTLVAQGSLEELRAGVEAQHPDAVGATQKATLEETFLNVLGTTGTAPPEQELSWLG
jgi:ABC-2 type transport system ATP-binding protein